MNANLNKQDVSKFLDKLFIDFLEFIIKIRTKKKGSLPKYKKKEYQRILDCTKKKININDTYWRFNIKFSKDSFYNHWNQFIYNKNHI